VLLIQDNPVNVCKEHLCMELQSGREFMRIVRTYQHIGITYGYRVMDWHDKTSDHVCKNIC